MKDVKKRFHYKQYVLVILFMGLLVLVETKLSFLRNDLIGAPFLLILTITALFGDYIAVIIAIIIGVFGIALISVHSAHYVDSVTIRRSSEFLVGGIIIFILSFRSRQLAKTHLSLEETIQQLENATKQLNSQMKIKQKDVSKLNKLNHELREVIDNVMEDQVLWENSIKDSIEQKEQHKI